MSLLSQRLNSTYIGAANRLRGTKTARQVVVYVESYDDILFWRSILQQLERPDLHFDIVLPSSDRLGRGKKEALAQRLGENMIACVDADYDYMLQGATLASKKLLSSPYVLHTYAYSIENHRCYAPYLQQLCVMAVLNDTKWFDFEAFLAAYSVIIFPLLVWNVWAYRYEKQALFSLSDFAKIVALSNFNPYQPDAALASLSRRINQRLNMLRHQFPEGKQTYHPLREEFKSLGIKAEESYLYMRGHDLVNLVILPMLASVCEQLRRQREQEIRRLAVHHTQQQNELSAYQNTCLPIELVLNKHTFYAQSPLVERILSDARKLFDTKKATSQK